MLSLAARVLPEFDPPAVINAAAGAGWEAVERAREVLRATNVAMGS